MAEQQTYYKITVSGDLGSGKSTICKLLQRKLAFNVYSMGEAWRKLAAKHNMTILELNTYSETHPLDEEMDQAMAAMANEPQNIIFDSRLAWHFIPGSFKVHLTVDPQIAAARIFHDKRGEAEGYADINEAFIKINQRKISENNRYLQKYGIDCSQYSNYDLVVDTGHAAPESIATLITAEFTAWMKGQSFERHWLSPKTPFPLHASSSLNRSKIQSMASSLPNSDFPEMIPLNLLESHGFYFIYNGHHRISAALLKEVNFIPVKIIACNNQTIPDDGAANEYIQQHYSLQNIHQWENLHQFKYPRYPNL